MMGADFSEANRRFAVLQNLLASDPRNLNLLTDAAEAAIAARLPDVAVELLKRYAAQAPLPPEAMGMAGLAAMQTGDFAAATECFEQLLADEPDSPTLRFNLAWSRAMLKDFDEALSLLDAATAESLPQAAMLHIQLLHDRGEFETAAAHARRYVDIFPDHEGLMAAVSVLAIDVEDTTLAAACANRGGAHPDALTTLGVLALGEDRGTDAMALFSRALDQNDHAPRAWVGKGLAELSAGAHVEAARDIQRGAELFGDHIGSWIAAGWAHIVSGDIVSARPCFERALALDDNFSESQGSMAVVAILENRIDEARERANVAVRLDRKSFSGALAQALLLNGAGNAEGARKLIERALHTPIDASGRTVAHALAKQGLSA